ncbi:rhodanese-like domain-containing protein [Alkalibacillus haloalkaliphilus]|uniref:rhodanese-like domain-containing protein n=1 Tax=Alkalibacillus haloalkaliphilus TaxID=94136 RepID=UPI00031341A6|nr:rhodanese-like domain-containing protein [Alkalibacillus haloalkaliphilus]
MKKNLIFITIITVLTLLVACGGTEVEADYQTIELDEVLTKQDEGFTIVDVREVNEYEAGHIDGAINKPLSEIREGNFESLVDDEPYVIICKTGNRSQQASDLLSKQGFDVINVSEGMSSWQGDIVQ